MIEFDFSTKDAIAIVNELQRAERELVTLKARHAEWLAHHNKLWSRLQQLVGTPEETGEQVIRRVEGHIKRSMTQVLHDGQRKGLGAEEAIQHALRRGDELARDVGLTGLSESVKRHLRGKARNIYEKSEASRRLLGEGS